jgi:hypothetical protein
MGSLKVVQLSNLFNGFVANADFSWYPQCRVVDDSSIKRSTIRSTQSLVSF